MTEILFTSFWLEVFLILLLILVNGFFAGAEIALISIRRSRVKQLMEEGRPTAAVIHRMKEDPDRFLATVQIGVTFVGTLASAIGGAAAVRLLQPFLADLPLPGMARASGVIALTLVVLLITYLSLVLGELVPKSVALRHPERVAFLVAWPIELLSRFSHLLVRLLTASSSAVLWPFGGKAEGEASLVTAEEIKLMIQEGKEKGLFDAMEQELIHSVFEFTEVAVRAVMVPRPRVHAVQVDAPVEEVLRTLAEVGHSRYPVYRTTLDDVFGVLYYKDILRCLVEKKPIVLSELIRPTFFAPETMKVGQLLKELQRRRIGMAMVVDEHGGIEGVVTVEDLIEEIVGEIHDEYDDAAKPVQRLRDGSLVIDGALSIKDLAEQYGIVFPESPDYETVAGFVVAQLQRLPKGGDIVRFEDKKITVVDMEGRRIARVKLEPAAPRR